MELPLSLDIFSVGAASRRGLNDSSLARSAWKGIPPRDPSRRVRRDRALPRRASRGSVYASTWPFRRGRKPISTKDTFGTSRTNHAVPYGTDLLGHVFQALRAWLPSFSPYGTACRHAKRPNSNGSCLQLPGVAIRRGGPSRCSLIFRFFTGIIC
jgi:hypothetical protein